MKEVRILTRRAEKTHTHDLEKEGLRALAIDENRNQAKRLGPLGSCTPDLTKN